MSSGAADVRNDAPDRAEALAAMAAGGEAGVAAPPRARVPAPLRALRATRVVFHVMGGLATTVVVFPWVDDAARRKLTRRWSERLLELLRVRARVDGSLDLARGNVLVVANHVSWLDIFVLSAQAPARFVAKSDLARWPLLGRLIRNAGTIFVVRERRRDTRRVNEHATQVLLAGGLVAVFPEGTTTDGTTLLKFHASLLQPIVDSAGDVQPVAIRYRDAVGAHSAAPVYGDETFATSFWRVCGETEVVAELIASAPIAAGGAHRRQLAREAEDAIRRALGFGDGRGPGTPPGPAA